MSKNLSNEKLLISIKRLETSLMQLNLLPTQLNFIMLISLVKQDFLNATIVNNLILFAKRPIKFCSTYRLMK
jgi:hypothetical protein